ncbi:hypothetical protein FNV43_RR14773 [Rhamnella rubrinervis]|uniref:Uncharacterized protein n=1 Tax=Rhamnella rubrinervis TaxID=2594499 RepID=A0A8K0H3Y3_9ROSA|nr:hypothetical protein FNV43_RR14773 [Rhamnella rubrinervis]
MSVRSSVSTDAGANKGIKNELRLSPLRNSFAPTTSIPSMVPDRPLTSKATMPHVNQPTLQPHHVGFDERIMQKGSNTTDPLLLSAPPTSLLRDVRRTSVAWDQEAGRYVSVPASASEARTRTSMQIGFRSNAETSSYIRKPAAPQQEPSSSAVKSPVQQGEKLMYTGDSIFFGGPLLSVPARDGQKNERGLGSRDAQERVTLNLPRESRFKRDSVSNQLPVFVPGGFDHNPLSGSGLR